jgi:hypothetical protein
MTDQTKKPKITVMGEAVDYDSLPEPSVTPEFADLFKPVRISPPALDIASKIIPSQYWMKDGLHAFLQGRADKVFQGLSYSLTKGQYGKVKYIFEYDADGPVLKTVSLV